MPSFIEYPPMQAGTSFNVGDLEEKIEVAMKAAQTHNQQAWVRGSPVFAFRSRQAASTSI
jgi:hypothetical protein